MSSVRVQGRFIKRIEIFDSNGKRVLRKSNLGATHDIALNIAHLATGSYIIIVKDKIGTQSGVMLTH